MKLDIRINVFLRDGTQYLGHNAPNDDPFVDQHGRLVRFFDKSSDVCVIVIPMDLVARLEIYQEKGLG